MGSNLATYLFWATLFLSSKFSTAMEFSPFFLAKENFTYTAKNPKGSFQVMDPFTELSFRVAILEASPQTFVLPSHLDADELLYVIKGRGVITQIPRGKKGLNKQEIVEGDVLWIPAGTVVDLVNADRESGLRVVVLLKTLSSTTGDYKEFFGAGGVEPESFLRVFSSDIMAAAFRSRKEEVEKILGRQKKGAFIKVTEDQIQALTSGQGTPHSFPLLSKKPSFSNDHGQMHELTVGDYPYLRLLDAEVSLANISAGSMIAPSYNSKATKIAIVVSGEGYVEIVQRNHGEYVKVASKVSAGDAFLVSAGEPVSTSALGGEGLQVLCFGLNVEENRRVFLAGENGVLKNLEREVTDLSFGVPWKEVDEVLKAQRKSIFMEGPKEMPKPY